ncbi:MAG: twin-arginine translocation signal domain-containing protein [Pseudomonadota bacterium]
MRPLSRRNFIRTVATVSVVGGVGGWLFGGRFETYGRGVLKNVYGASVANSTSARAFLKAMSKRWMKRDNPVLSLVDRIQYGALLPMGLFPDRAELLKTELVTLFALSTNIQTH